MVEKISGRRGCLVRSDRCGRYLVKYLGNRIDDGGVSIFVTGRANNRDDSVNHHGTGVYTYTRARDDLWIGCGLRVRARKPLTSANRCGL